MKNFEKFSKICNFFIINFEYKNVVYVDNILNVELNEMDFKHAPKSFEVLCDREIIDIEDYQEVSIETIEKY